MVSRNVGIAAAAVILIGAGAGVAVALSPSKAQIYAKTPGYAQGNVTLPAGVAPVYAIVVPTSTTPISVQGYSEDPASQVVTAGNINTWDIATTGYTYDLTGLSHVSGTVLKIWALVTFSDGSNSKTNTLTVSFV